MNFTQFTILYRLFVCIFNFLIICSLAIFFYNSFHHFTSSGIIEATKDFDLLQRNTSFIWANIKPWLWSVLTVIINVAVIAFIKTVFKNIPVPSSWLSAWDKSGQISPLMGRHLARHFRWHRFLRSRQLMEYFHFSQGELSLLKYHSGNSHTCHILNKYDEHYQHDMRAIVHTGSPRTIVKNEVPLEPAVTTITPTPPQAAKKPDNEANSPQPPQKN